MRLSQFSVMMLVVGCATRSAPDVATSPTAAPSKPANVTRAFLDELVVEKSAQPEKKAKISYVCPMHPEIVSDKPGSCSKCGMSLQEQHAH